MSARAWLGLAEAPQQAMPEPGVEDVPWAAAMTPVVLARFPVVAPPLTDGQRQVQRTPVWGTVEAAFNAAWRAEDARAVFAALAEMERSMGAA